MTDPWTQDPLVREDAELRALLDRLASSATDPVDPATRVATLERVLAAAAERPVAPPAPTWRRRAQQVLAMTGAKVVLAAGVAAATTGGLAATGTLPDPAQHFVHEVGERIGIGFPEAPQLKAEREPARRYAPGQQAHEHGDHATDHAPGLIGRDAQDPAPVVPLAPVPGPATGGSADQAPGRPDDPGSPASPEAPKGGQAPDREPGPAAEPPAPDSRPDPTVGTDGDAPVAPRSDQPTPAQPTPPADQADPHADGAGPPDHAPAQGAPEQAPPESAGSRAPGRS